MEKLNEASLWHAFYLDPDIAEIKDNPKITIPDLMSKTNFSEPTINRVLKKLRENGLITRVGAKKNGLWNVLK